MELDPTSVSTLFSAAPWAFVAALVVWPEKGIVALWIRRGQAIKLAEIERNTTHEAIKIESKRNADVPRLGSPEQKK